jgi:F-type H+-transporting ATPase subunit delta
LSVVSTYAEALFEAARERSELEGVLEDLQEFVDALEESEELRLFFYGGQVPEREKRRAIDALTEGMTLPTRNFLKILSDNGREEILEEVVLRYEELVKEHLGRVEVEVTTAVELSDEELERIRERLGRSLEGREVILQTSVDPNILGGAVFRFGGRMVDSSVRGRLASLREEMLERGVASG